MRPRILYFNKLPGDVDTLVPGPQLTALTQAPPQGHSEGRTLTEEDTDIGRQAFSQSCAELGMNPTS